MSFSFVPASPHRRSLPLPFPSLSFPFPFPIAPTAELLLFNYRTVAPVILYLEAMDWCLQYCNYSEASKQHHITTQHITSYHNRVKHRPVIQKIKSQQKRIVYLLTHNRRYRSCDLSNDINTDTPSVRRKQRNKNHAGARTNWAATSDGNALADRQQL